MKNYFFLILFAVSAVFTSCSKDDDAKPSKTKMLTAKSWRLAASVSEDNQSAGTTDHFSSMKDCEKDNLLKFSTDKTYTYEEGPTKCKTSDPQISDTGTWAFIEKETKLQITSDGEDPVDMEIVEITSSKLVTRVKFDFDMGGGQRYTGSITQTYKN